MRQVRISVADTLISSFLFVFVVSFPFQYFSSYLPSYAITILELCLRMFLTGYYLRLIFKYNISLGKINFKNLLFFIPFLLAAFTNLFAFPFANEIVTSTFNWVMILDVLIIIFTAFNEEILFRLFIYNSLRIENRLLKIVAGAGIFAAFHLLNLITPSFLAVYQSVLIQSVYTFALGLILCFMYEFTMSVIPCIVFHFIFNFFNQFLVTVVFYPFYSSYFPLYTALTIGCALAIYGILIYSLKFKKDPNSLSYNQYFD